jgi:hypothetical protein
MQSNLPPLAESADQSLGVTDLRAVPLEELAGDDDARRLVSMTFDGLNDSSQSQVARFNSSI